MPGPVPRTALGLALRQPGAPPPAPPEAAAAPTGAPPIAGYSAWYDASDAATITDAGSGHVSTWANKGPTGGNLTQATDNRRPITGTRTSPTGLNVLDSDGSNDKMGNASAITASDVTIFLVVKSDDPSNPRCPFEGFSATAAIYHESSTWWRRHLSEGGISDDSGLATTANAAVVSATFSSGGGASDNLWLDGAAGSAADVGGTTTLGQFQCFSNDTNNIVWDGWIGEILIYPSVLSDTDRIATEAFLTAKWITAPSGVTTAAQFGGGVVVQTTDAPDHPIPAEVHVAALAKATVVDASFPSLEIHAATQAKATASKATTISPRETVGVVVKDSTSTARTANGRIPVAGPPQAVLTGARSGPSRTAAATAASATVTGARSLAARLTGAVQVSAVVQQAAVILTAFRVHVAAGGRAAVSAALNSASRLLAAPEPRTTTSAGFSKPARVVAAPVPRATVSPSWTKPAQIAAAATPRTAVTHTLSASSRFAAALVAREQITTVRSVNGRWPTGLLARADESAAHTFALRLPDGVAMKATVSQGAVTLTAFRVLGGAGFRVVGAPDHPTGWRNALAATVRAADAPGFTTRLRVITAAAVLNVTDTPGHPVNALFGVGELLRTADITEHAPGLCLPTGEAFRVTVAAGAVTLTALRVLGGAQFRAAVAANHPPGWHVFAGPTNRTGAASGRASRAAWTAAPTTRVTLFVARSSRLLVPVGIIVTASVAPPPPVFIEPPFDIVIIEESSLELAEHSSLEYAEESGILVRERTGIVVNEHSEA